MNLWPHQTKGIDDVLAAIARGERRILLTSPTGAGKSVMVCEIILRLVREGWYAVLYANRRVLIEQLRGVMGANNIAVGMRAANYQENLERPVQIASLQTERQRTLVKGDWEPHGAEHEKTLVLVDEAHLNTGDTCQQLFDYHLSRGHTRLGITASPLGLGADYSHLIVAGTNTECRRCGALVEAHHYGPDEPDMRKFQKAQDAGQDPPETQQAMMATDVVYGRVLEWFNTLNRERRPTILFGPSVGGSLWYAQRFNDDGIRAAHVDGNMIWLDGECIRRTPGEEDPINRVIAGSKAGEITVVCNRFVMREGVDMPWISHCVLACIFGSLQSYLQAGGRVLRSYPGKTHATIQDHGGHWWRHSSLNVDRNWDLALTNSICAGLRLDSYKNRSEKPPFSCPRCKAIVGAHLIPSDGMIVRCPRCGFGIDTRTRSRTVIEADGTLREMTGDIFRPRRFCEFKDRRLVAKWIGYYWKSRNGRLQKNDDGTEEKIGWYPTPTFRQVAAVFAQDSQWRWPHPKWPLMPRRKLDWFKPTTEVPLERLTYVPASTKGKAQ